MKRMLAAAVLASRADTVRIHFEQSVI